MIKKNSISCSMILLFLLSQSCSLIAEFDRSKIEDEEEDSGTAKKDAGSMDTDTDTDTDTEFFLIIFISP